MIKLSYSIIEQGGVDTKEKVWTISEAQGVSNKNKRPRWQHKLRSESIDDDIQK